MTPGARLRSRLADGAILVPGVHDALTARIAHEAGFDVVFVSGAAVTAVQFAQPDLGYLGATDIESAARTVASAAGQLVVVDADTGYGNALHAASAVRRLARAGAAAVVIEDQVAPKRCGAVDGKEVVETDEFVRRIASAVDASPDTLIVARTDAFALGGLDEVVARCGAAARAGAALVFPAGVADVEVLRELRQRCGAPLVVNLSEAAAPPEGWPSVENLAAAGAGLMIAPVLGLLAAAHATFEAFRNLASTGASALRPSADWARLTDWLGLPQALAEERRWADYPTKE